MEVINQELSESFLAVMIRLLNCPKSQTAYHALAIFIIKAGRPVLLIILDCVSGEAKVTSPSAVAGYKT